MDSMKLQMFDALGHAIAHGEVGMIELEEKATGEMRHVLCIVSEPDVEAGEPKEAKRITPMAVFLDGDSSDRFIQNEGAAEIVIGHMFHLPSPQEMLKDLLKDPDLSGLLAGFVAHRRAQGDKPN